MEKYNHIEKIERLTFIELEKTIGHLERIAKDKKIDNEIIRQNLMNNIVMLFKHSTQSF